MLDRVCLNCGGTYNPHRSDDRFCSEKCGNISRVKNTKGKTTEEIYGRERAAQMRAHISSVRKGRRLWKVHPMLGKHHSEESRKKMSLAHKGSTGYWKGKSGPEAPFYGKHLSDEAKSKISNSKLGRKASPETREKLSLALRGIPKTEEWKLKASENWDYKKHFTPEIIKHMSEAHKGVGRGRVAWNRGIPHTIEARMKIARAERGVNNHWYGKVPPHKKKCMTLKGHWVRSTWERDVCDWLFQNGIEYQYEPQTFNLGDFNYIPDIYIPQWGVYWEIKGYWNQKSINQVTAFNNQYDNLMIIDKENIGMFRGE